MKCEIPVDVRIRNFRFFDMNAISDADVDSPIGLFGDFLRDEVFVADLPQDRGVAVHVPGFPGINWVGNQWKFLPRTFEDKILSFGLIL